MNQQPDFIALAIVGVLLLGVLIAVLRKYFARKNGTAAPVEAAPTQTAEAAQAPQASGSAGKMKLHDVSPKTAAMAMAIVADSLNKPISELRFISIREVTEK